MNAEEARKISQDNGHILKGKHEKELDYVLSKIKTEAEKGEVSVLVCVGFLEVTTKALSDLGYKVDDHYFGHSDYLNIDWSC